MNFGKIRKLPFTNYEITNSGALGSIAADANGRESIPREGKEYL